MPTTFKSGAWGVGQVFLQLRLRQAERWEPALLQLTGTEDRQTGHRPVRAEPFHRKLASSSSLPSDGAGLEAEGWCETERCESTKRAKRLDS